MTIKNVLAAVVVLSLCGTGAAAAAEREEMTPASTAGATAPMAIMSDYSPKTERPAILPALYVTLGAMQALDIYTTRAAIEAGAREANPMAVTFSGNAASLVGLKAAATAGTIFFAERMWKKTKVGAIVMLVAVNGATAAVSMHNMRAAKRLR